MSRGGGQSGGAAQAVPAESVGTPSPRTPLALCMIVRDAAQTIDVLLGAVLGPDGPHLSEYVLVDTGSADDTRERIAARLAGPGAAAAGFRWPAPGEPPWVGFRNENGARVVLASFGWIDDFAAARNFSFSLATAPWLAWLDADDVPADVDAWETTLAAVVRQFPQANACAFDYDYGVGCVEPDKVRMVRRADGWRWRGIGAARGRVHEQLLCDGGRRAIGLPIRVAHCPPERGDSNIERNRPLLEMELADCEAAHDRTGAAVIHYHLAREAIAMGRHEDGERHAEAAVRDSDGGAAGVAALLVLARAQLNRHELAAGARSAGAVYALARDPQALAVMAVAATERGRHEDAVAWYGDVRACPRTALVGVWDPVLMDGAVHIAAAHSLLALGRDEEAIAALARVTDEARQHSPTDAAFKSVGDRVAATQACGTDRVAIVVPGTAASFDPDSPAEGHCGGSEEAVIHLSRALARRGCDVTVYAPPVPGRPPLPRDGVLWRASETFDPGAMPRGSALMVWRVPGAILHPAIKASRARKVLWLHDASYGVGPDVYGVWDRVVTLSGAHEQSLRERDGFAGPFARASNGIDPDEFPAPDESRRDPHRCVYASSPNRGLDHLLEVWPDVRAAVPDASLDVGYDWAMFRRMFGAWAARLEARMAELAPMGVRFRGGMRHAELHDLMRSAGVLSYPCTYHETSCILGLKAPACGCWPVTTRVGALPETILTGDLIPGIDWSRWPGGEPPHEAVLWEENGCVQPGATERDALHGLRDDYTRRYRDALIARLLNPPTPEQRAVARERVLARFSWDAAAVRFKEILFGGEP